MIREDLRNIAIIAHVDHGKTTLVDQMLKQSGAFRSNQIVAERVMDSGDLERERGITILAKNTSVFYETVKISIIDTPGHVDFGGEVERVLKMVNGVLLLVDAFEGPMPQTRFVLGKALELGHKIILIINKVDRPDARVAQVEDEVLELLIDLDATEEQLNSPVVYCSAKQGVASLDIDQPGLDLIPLFDAILSHIPAPEGDPNKPFQMLVSSIDYDDYVGRVAIGCIENGEIRPNQEIAVCQWNQKEYYKGKITNLYHIEGLKREATDQATIGEIVCVSGIEHITIGETLCALDAPNPLPFVKISEPTMEMTFSVNDSPFVGREGKYVTSRHLRDRLQRELLKDVSLRVEETDTTESFTVYGRGEMHLSILIETMRREGYEFQVGAPRVLYKTINEILQEPMEQIFIDVPEQNMGTVIEKMGLRKGELTQMAPQGSRMRLEFLIPTRGLFGYRNEFLTDTRGEGVLSSLFAGYQPFRGEIPSRNTGSLVAFESGEAVAYGLYNAQERGVLFIGPGTPVYAGMIVGMSPKAEDLDINVCKKKHITNIRASGSDDALRLSPYRRLSLEEAIEFIADDELLEVTPKNIRLRKRILNKELRIRAKKA